MPSLELPGENVAPNAQAIAMAPTRAIWRQRQVDSKISRYPEIGKANSTARSLNATAAMNRISPKASPRCLWQERVHIKSEKWREPCWESHPVEVTISRLNQSLSH